MIYKTPVANNLDAAFGIVAVEVREHVVVRETVALLDRHAGHECVYKLVVILVIAERDRVVHQISNGSELTFMAFSFCSAMVSSSFFSASGLALRSRSSAASSLALFFKPIVFCFSLTSLPLVVTLQRAGHQC